MLWFKKVRKIDIPLVIEQKLRTILPYCKNDKERLQVISYVNNYIGEIVNEAKFIYVNFKRVGLLIVDKDILDTLYIIDKYQKRGIGTKVLKRYKFINKIIVRNGNNKALAFYRKNGFEIDKKEKNKTWLRRAELK